MIRSIVSCLLITLLALLTFADAVQSQTGAPSWTNQVTLRSPKDSKASLEIMCARPPKALLGIATVSIAFRPKSGATVLRFTDAERGELIAESRVYTAEGLKDRESYDITWEHTGGTEINSIRIEVEVTGGAVEIVKTQVEAKKAPPVKETEFSDLEALRNAAGETGIDTKGKGVDQKDHGNEPKPNVEPTRRPPVRKKGKSAGGTN